MSHWGFQNQDIRAEEYVSTVNSVSAAILNRYIYMDYAITIGIGRG